MKFEMSKWDTEHFEFSVAKSFFDLADTELSVKQILKACLKLPKPMLVICRVPTDNYRVTHELEAMKAQLMDTLVCWNRSLEEFPVLSETDISYGLNTPEDTQEIVAICGDSYTDFISHFHQDPKLNKGRVIELYKKWAYNSCIGDMGNGITVAKYKGKVVGFMAMTFEEDIGDLTLAAVSKNFRGKGIYRGVVYHSCLYFIKSGLKKAKVLTQVNNYAPQKAWAGLGFKPYKSVYTFHLWI